MESKKGKKTGKGKGKKKMNKNRKLQYGDGK